MKIILRIVFLLLATNIGVHQTSAQALDPTFAAIDIQQSGVVYSALQQPDGKYLVGGAFTQVNGSPAVGLARLNADGSLDNAFTSAAACQSDILKIRLLTNGHVLLQNNGRITVGGRSFNTLAKLNADGSVDLNFSAGSGPSGGTSSYAYVVAVREQADGKILVGGVFSSFNGVTTNSLVRLNTDGTVDRAFTHALGNGFVHSDINSSSVRDIAVQPDGKILVCGEFQNYNNTNRNNLVRLNSDGSLDTSFNHAFSPFNFASMSALALDPRTNYVLVYGNGFAARKIIRLTTNGQIDNSFVLSEDLRCISYGVTNSEEFAVDASGRVLLSGCFSNYGETDGDTYVTRLLANGQRDPQFAIRRQLDGRVYSVKVLANGEVLLGGDLGRYGALRNVSLVRVNNTAQALTTFRPAIMRRGHVSEVVRQADNKLLIGGRFWQINGRAAGNVARLNPDGTLDDAFELTGVDGQVEELAVQPDGRILVGGAFETAGSHASPLVARLLANGRADASFSAPMTDNAAIVQDNRVTALALQLDGRVLIGGRRFTLGGYSSPLHRLLPNGTIDSEYAGRVGASVLGASVVSLLALPDGKHYVGGGGSERAPALQRLNADGSRDNTFATASPTSTSNLYITRLLALPNNQLLVGGSFSAYNGTVYSNLVRLNADGTVDTDYELPSLDDSSIITSLARYTNGRVLVGSHGNIAVNGTNRGSLVRLNANGSYDPIFTASFSNELGIASVYALALQADESFVVGGNFTQVNGQPRASLTRLTAPTVLAIGSRQSAARTEAWPNPVQDLLYLSLDAEAKPCYIKPQIKQS